MYEVKLPQTSDEFSDSVIVFWHKSEGDHVEAGEVLVEVQTEKAIFEIEAEESGILAEIKVPRGEVARVGDVLATISPIAVANQKQANVSAETMLDEVGDTDIVHASSQQSIKVAPRIRRLARELGIDLAKVNATGRNGHITEEDIRRAAEADMPTEYKVIPFAGIRKTIAKRMTDSLLSTAQLTVTAWADVTLLDQERKQMMGRFTWNDLILYAVVQALKGHHDINALVFEEIQQYEKVHLGVAVDSEAGLFVPVVKNADDLSLEQLAIQVRLLAEKAKLQRLLSEELTGATFTVTNLGGFGIRFFTPIINQPEAGILGVGEIDTDLMLKDGQIVERKRLPLSLTFDHRAIDGAPAARFIQTIKGYLGNPTKIFEDSLIK